ncbi:MAG: cold shock domain-containing protein [Proteobacteria bacterium]|nr:cold shock domain-containing protein [Candidatus Enterousia onthequi]
MRQGKVKWYNGKKCFGFIAPDTPNADGNMEDVFVHSSALKEAGIRFLNENDIVEFEEEPRNGKLSVTTLRVVQRDEESAQRFQERRAARRRASEERKQRAEHEEHAERAERKRGFAFWKK